MGISQHLGLAMMGADIQRQREEILKLAGKNPKLKSAAKILCQELDKRFDALHKLYNKTVKA